MEGDAGASRLNPIDTDDDSLSPQDKDEDSTAPASTDEQTVSQGAPGVAGESAPDHADDAVVAAVPRGPSRLGHGWLASIAAVLVLCAAGIGASGYLACATTTKAR